MQNVPNPPVPPLPPPPPPVGAAVAPPQPQAIAFALMPAQAQPAGLINYQAREGLELFKSNTRPFYTDTTALFNCQSEGLLGFLNHITTRIREADWGNIFEVPEDVNQPGVDTVPFMFHHGRYGLAHLRAFAATYIGQQNREAQNNFQAATAIMASLSEAGQNKLFPWRDHYTITDANGTPHIAAVCLIKVIIRESHIDSNATTRIARENLSSLDVHLKKQGYDVDKLNTFVRQQLDILSSRGETTNDLLTNLFKAYKSAIDQKFVDYIKTKEDQHDDGDIELTPESLMILAAKKYRVMVETGKWNAPSADQVKLLALETRINQLQAAAKKQSSTGNRNRGGGSTNNTPKKETPAWALVKPSQHDIDNEVPQQHDGKDHWWCPAHGRLVQHKPSQCKKAQANKEKDKNKDTPNDAEKALKLATALQATMDQQESDNEQE